MKPINAFRRWGILLVFLIGLVSALGAAQDQSTPYEKMTQAQKEQELIRLGILNADPKDITVKKDASGKTKVTITQGAKLQTVDDKTIEYAVRGGTIDTSGFSGTLRFDEPIDSKGVILKTGKSELLIKKGDILMLEDGWIMLAKNLELKQGSKLETPSEGKTIQIHGTISNMIASPQGIKLEAPKGLHANGYEMAGNVEATLSDFRLAILHKPPKLESKPAPVFINGIYIPPESMPIKQDGKIIARVASIDPKKPWIVFDLENFKNVQMPGFRTIYIEYDNQADPKPRRELSGTSFRFVTNAQSCGHGSCIVISPDNKVDISHIELGGIYLKVADPRNDRYSIAGESSEGRFTFSDTKSRRLEFSEKGFQGWGDPKLLRVSVDYGLSNGDRLQILDPLKGEISLCKQCGTSYEQKEIWGAARYFGEAIVSNTNAWRDTLGTLTQEQQNRNYLSYFDDVREQALAQEVFEGARKAKMNPAYLAAAMGVEGFYDDYVEKQYYLNYINPNGLHTKVNGYNALGVDIWNTDYKGKTHEQWMRERGLLDGLTAGVDYTYSQKIDQRHGREAGGIVDPVDFNSITAAAHGMGALLTYSRQVGQEIAQSQGSSVERNFNRNLDEWTYVMYNSGFGRAEEIVAKFQGNFDACYADSCRNARRVVTAFDLFKRAKVFSIPQEFKSASSK